MILTTLAATLLRLWDLGRKSLWMDEAASVALARMPWQQFRWVWWLQEGNMATYYLLLQPWIHLGQSSAFLRLLMFPSAIAWVNQGLSEMWIRLLSVIFGVATIPILYLLARRLTNTRTALIASALLAVSPPHIYYSQEARSYSMAIFFVLLSALFFVRAIEQNRTRDWPLWILASVIAVYSHYFATLVLLALVSSLLLLRPSRVPWTRLLVSGLAITVLTSPGIWFVVSRGNTLRLPWIPSPTPKEIVHLWMFLSGSGPKFVIWLLLWAAGVVVIARTWKKHGRSEESWRIALCLVWALLPVVVTVLASLHHSVFAQKYLLVCLPATVLLAAIGADSLRTRHIGTGLVIGLCLLSLGTDWRAYRKPREDWRTTVHTVLSSSQSGDAVVFYPFYTRVAFDFYQERYQLRMGPSAPKLRVFAPPFYGSGEDERDLQRDLASRSPSFQHVWVVLYGPDARPEDLLQRAPALASLLQADYPQMQPRQFKDIAVLEFSR